MSTTVTGSVNFDCGRRIKYDDSNDEHRRRRLEPAIRQVTCPDHGLENACYAVIGPPRLLWPNPRDYAEVMAELGHEWVADQ